jgi:hypothetical protein
METPLKVGLSTYTPTQNEYSLLVLIESASSVSETIILQLMELQE